MRRERTFTEQRKEVFIMKLSSFGKRISLCVFLFLALFLLPNPVSDRFVFTAKASSDVNTEDETSKIKLNVKSKDLILDDEYTLKVYRTTEKQKITFKSSEPSVATVKKTDDKAAKISACEVGKTTITVTVKEGSKTITSLKCEVTVTPPAVSIKLIDGKTSIRVGDKVTLKKELKPSTTSETPTYISSNTNVVTVSSRGVVTAVGEGKAYLYAIINNGTYDYCIIEVTASVE